MLFSLIFRIIIALIAYWISHSYLTGASAAQLQWHLSNMNVTPWWRHQLETFSTLLAICAGNSPVTGEFPAQRLVTRSFDVFFDLPLNEQLSKQSWGWWSEMLSHPLWRHSNVTASQVLCKITNNGGTYQSAFSNADHLQFWSDIALHINVIIFKNFTPLAIALLPPLDTKASAGKMLNFSIFITHCWWISVLSTYFLYFGQKKNSMLHNGNQDIMKSKSMLTPHQWSGSSVVQVMAWCHTGSKASPKTMTTRALIQYKDIILPV